MARPLRLEYPGAVYHVTARGHERSSIFRNDADRKKFLELLGSIVRDEKWLLHAYCLMSNHYHLLVETPFGSLSRGMRSLNGRYSQWFNWRHRRSGHLFEGRFRSVLVQKETHLLELCRYVVLNPVRAGFVRQPGDWRWSNYQATAAGKRTDWLEVDWTLAQFESDRGLARQEYRRFVAMGKGKEEAKALLRGPYLGDREFRRRLQKMIEGKPPADQVPTRFRRAAEPSLQAIRRAVAAEWKVSEDGLSRSRGGEDKKAAIYLARKLTRLGGRDIGEAFGVKAARVSNIVTEIERERGSRFHARLDKLRARLGQSV
jgi:REP element-mobilizing transposase RayT